jgi:HK97 family phage major capsid protein
MTVAANGSPTAEMKQTLIELKKGLEEAVEKKASIETVTRLQAQVDAIDVRLAQRHTSDMPQKSLFDTLKENESVSRILRDRKGHAVINLDAYQASAIMARKSVISAVTSGSAGSDTLNPVGVATSGVLQIERIPGITPEARQVLKIRDVLSARPTTLAMVDFVKVTSPMSIASPVPEASLKPENSLTFASVSEKVKLIATWIPATRQVLDDLTELMGFIQTSLPYYIDLEEELQLLSGDNAGEDLHGIIPQAAAFNSSLLPSAAKGWNKIDVVGAAIQQVNAAKEIDPTFIVLNVNDWWGIRLTKDGFGRYILGDPQSTVNPNIFGLSVVSTTSIPAGTFLVGSGSPVAAEIRDRMGMEVEISTEHSDYFVRNLIAIRAEKRLALVTKRPNSFVSGTFTTSP